VPLRGFTVGAAGHHTRVRRTTFTLPPSPASARVARDRLRAFLASWRDDDTRAAVVLLTSELVTNAVLHARSQVTVRLDVTEERLRVHVDDESPTVPVRREARPDLPGGRGLLLLDSIAERWGVLPGATGKSVWFEVSSAA
jgi:anti-sigma regulatory factor (Ser/Thr protein kinase)